MKSRRGHPRRDVVLLAFERAQGGKYKHEIDLTPVTGMNVDMAAHVIRATETLREAEEDRIRQDPKHTSLFEFALEWRIQRRLDSILREQVREAAFPLEVPPTRRHAYEVVAMNYYGLIKEFQEENRKAREAAKQPPEDAAA